MTPKTPNTPDQDQAAAIVQVQLMQYPPEKERAIIEALMTPEQERTEEQQALLVEHMNAVKAAENVAGSRAAILQAMANKGADDAAQLI